MCFVLNNVCWNYSHNTWVLEYPFLFTQKKISEPIVDQCIFKAINCQSVLKAICHMMWLTRRRSLPGRSYPERVKRRFVSFIPLRKNVVHKVPPSVPLSICRPAGTNPSFPQRNLPYRFVWTPNPVFHLNIFDDGMDRTIKFLYIANCGLSLWFIRWYFLFVDNNMGSLNK